MSITYQYAQSDVGSRIADGVIFNRNRPDERRIAPYSTKVKKSLPSLPIP